MSANKSLGSPEGGPNPRNNGFFRTSQNSDEGMALDPENEQRMVPVGYFDRPPNTIANPSVVNSTGRYTENRMVSQVELPQLRKTIRSETLYSLKSTEGSPHQRMMQSLEKRKKRKPKKPVEPEVESLKSAPKGSKYGKIPKYGGSVTRNNVAKAKPSYEITTIKEDDENTTLDNSKKLDSRSAKKHNNRYNSMNPDLNRVMARNAAHHSSLTDHEYRKNVSPNRDHFDAEEKQIYPNSSMQYSVDNRMQGPSSDRQGKPTIGLPRLGGKIPGMTTKNGTFKPYTYSVSECNAHHVTLGFPRQV